MKNKSENSNIIKFNPDPSREEAMNAVKTLIAWAGDNPNREGLIETPKRVVDAYKAVSYTHLTLPTRNCV